MGWRKLIRAARHWFTSNEVLASVQVDDLPDQLAPGKLYLLGEGRFLWAIAMRCPCGCGDIIHMNLLPDARPSWRLIRHFDGTVSLHPSIWRQKGCRSHFFVRRSRVKWFLSSKIEKLPKKLEREERHV